MQEQIAVLGLGYVGLPLALALAEKYPGTIGFDINAARVAKLRDGIDENEEGLEQRLANTSLRITHDERDLAAANFFIVGVPTPVDENCTPDLRPLESACRIVAPHLKPDAVVVFESTVYPGLTEEVCGAWLAELSGLRPGRDFFLGYSPERMNPGDKERTVERIVKVVAGQDARTLDRVAAVYGSVVKAGIHRAPSIKVAEAAKVIENTQRDLNIALMNELSMIFDRLGIDTQDVLAAAGTKWNFNVYYPGLVGGHCIGVDPYYLTTKAQQVGYHPQVILAGRRINDSMGSYVGQRVVKLMVNANIPVKGARIGVLGVTFKENVSDLRNSRVPDIVRELQEFGAIPLVHDPLADPERAVHEYGIRLTPWEQLGKLDTVVLAVPHNEYRAMGLSKILEHVGNPSVIADVKACFRKEAAERENVYWSL